MTHIPPDLRAEVEKFYEDLLQFDMYDDGSPIVHAVYFETKETLLSFFAEREEKVRRDMCEDLTILSDNIEVKLGVPSMEEWRAFKAFRNQMRDKYLTPTSNQKEK